MFLPEPVSSKLCFLQAGSDSCLWQSLSPQGQVAAVTAPPSMLGCRVFPSASMGGMSLEKLHEDLGVDILFHMKCLGIKWKVVYTMQHIVQTTLNAT